MRNYSTVRVIEDSINPYNSIRVTTLELSYWRAIHSEFMTHRVFSRNASSSRAIPIQKIISQVWNDPAIPIHWGANQAGMQARNELSGAPLLACKIIWGLSSKVACCFAYAFWKLGLHKQVANRILEPWQYINVIVTSTEWDNFFGLRCHPDAQPEIRELAENMKKAIDESIPVERDHHLPYITDEERSNRGIDTLRKLSAARCARVSYKTHNNEVPTLGIDLDRYNRLVSATPIHASPLEHQLRALDHTGSIRNMTGWVQFRTIVEQSKNESPTQRQYVSPKYIQPKTYTIAGINHD